MSNKRFNLYDKIAVKGYNKSLNNMEGYVVGKGEQSGLVEITPVKSNYTIFVPPQHLRKVNVPNRTKVDLKSNDLVKIVRDDDYRPSLTGKYAFVDDVYIQTAKLTIVEKERRVVYIDVFYLNVIPRMFKAWVVYPKLIRQEELKRRGVSESGPIWETHDNYTLSDNNVFKSFADAVSYFRMFNDEALIKVK